MRLILVLCLMAAAPAFAAPPPASLPAPLQRVQNEGGTVIQSFPAPDGLTGWVMKIQGHYVIVYSTASGDYVISGTLVDKDGHNMTSAYGDKYIPKPDTAKLLAALGTDPWLVEEGSPKAPLMYVYADPNCIYCNKLWNDLRPYVESGKVRVRWALLDFLKRTSTGRAAAILSAHDRAAALAQDETKFDRTNEEGGIPELAPVPIEIGEILKRHIDEMNDAGAAGTPTMLVHRQDGWSIFYGAPKDMPTLIASLTR